MAEKTLLVTLLVTVSDLSDEERQSHAHDMCLPVDEVETIEDTHPAALAGLLAQHLEDDFEDPESTMFEGRDEMVKFVEANVVSAIWAIMPSDPAPPRSRQPAGSGS